MGNDLHIIEELETLRIKAKRNLIIVSSIFVFIGLVLFLTAYLQKDNSIFPLPVFIFFGIFTMTFLPLFCSNFITKRFVYTYKNKLVKMALTEDIDNLRYEPKTYVNKTILQESGVVSIGNRLSGSDFIAGTYKGVKFLTSDVLSQQVSSSSNSNISSSTTTLFEGRVFKYDFNKSFNGELYILEKASVISLGTSKFFGNNLHKQSFEDIEFNKEFNVLTSDDHMAFYIITPQFIEAFKKLNSSIEGIFSFAFKNGCLYVSTNNCKNSLEPKINKKINENTKEIIKQDIMPIKWFVDLLSLDVDKKL